MEIAFLSSNKLILELDKKESNKFRSHILGIFTANPSEYISTMLVGNNIMLVIYGIIVAWLLNEPLKRLVHNDGSILLIETIVSTMVMLITAEFCRKQYSGSTSIFL
jgi:CBS domain containing-hemolysin-like protein